MSQPRATCRRAGDHGSVIRRRGNAENAGDLGMQRLELKWLPEETVGSRLENPVSSGPIHMASDGQNLRQNVQHQEAQRPHLDEPFIAVPFV